MPGSRPVPVIVIDEPPAVDPTDGVTEVIVGAGAVEGPVGTVSQPIARTMLRMMTATPGHHSLGCLSCVTRCLLIERLESTMEA